MGSICGAPRPDGRISKCTCGATRLDVVPMRPRTVPAMTLRPAISGLQHDVVLVEAERTREVGLEGFAGRKGRLELEELAGAAVLEGVGAARVGEEPLLADARRPSWRRAAGVGGPSDGRLCVGRPAVAARVGFGSAFGSASSLAIDALLCVLSFGTGTRVATFLRCAYV